MKLYYTPGACSMASHILFHEWNIPHNIERVDLQSHKTEKGEDFYRINPKGYVPALSLDNGQTLTENIAILAYIGDSKSMPKGDKYKYLELLAFISTELHKGIGSLFGYKNGPADVVQGIKDKVAKRLQLLDKDLAGKEYIFGDSFSPADAYAVTVLNWCGLFNIDLSPYKNVHAYFNKMMTRPSVQKTLKAEGLVHGK